MAKVPQTRTERPGAPRGRRQAEELEGRPVASTEPPDGENRWAGVARLLLDIPWEETRPSDENRRKTWGCSFDTSKDDLTQPTVKAAAPRVAATSDNRALGGGPQPYPYPRYSVQKARH